MNYQTELNALKALLEGETDPISKMANLSAFVYEHLPRINWVGFYIVREGVLKVGPFQGKVACSTIEKGKGVCGTAWETGKTQVVADTHQFAGHIACDPVSLSEVVVPIFNEMGEMIAELDVDSPELNRFGREEVAFLEGCAKLI